MTPASDHQWRQDESVRRLQEALTEQQTTRAQETAAAREAARIAARERAAQWRDVVRGNA